MIRRLLVCLCALAIASTAQAQYIPGYLPTFRSGFQFVSGTSNFPAAGALADYDFARNRYSGPAISVSRSTPAYIDDTAGNWTSVAANTLRRSDKGILVEGAQTNSIRNSAIGSGGIPATWTTANPTGATRTTSPQTRNGIDGILITYSGTVTASSSLNLTFESVTQIAAASGQLWTGSAFFQVDSNNSGAGFTHSISERDNAGAQVGGGITNATIPTSSSLQRVVTSRTLTGATTAFVVNRITSDNISAGTPINIVVWVGWPQLEQWSTAITTVGGASSPIRTTGAAATRAADIVTAPIGGSLPGSVSMAGVYRSASFHAINGYYSSVNDGTQNNSIAFRNSGVTLGAVGLATIVGGTSPGNPNNFSGAAGDSGRHAFAFGAAGVSGSAFAVDGQSPSFNSSTYTFPSLTTLSVGGAGIGPQAFGYIERLVLYPSRLDNLTLQQQSTLSYWDSVGGFPAQGTIADYDFKNNRLSGPVISVSRASPAYVDDSQGNWSLVAANTLRRSDKGALIEGAQTNSIRNNSMQGAAGQSQNAIRNNSMQGAAPDPSGTLPTFWAGGVAGNGLTRQIVGTGTANGVDYIDIRYSGTNTATTVNLAVNLLFEGLANIPAASGQTWTHSVYLAVVAGSLPTSGQGASSPALTVTELSSTGTQLAFNTATVSIDGTLSRKVDTSTLSNASTAYVLPTLWIYGPTSSGQAVDFTIRIGSPQMEQAATAGTVTRTTGTAASAVAPAMPTNWGGAVGNGISRQVVGTGTENGIDYVDLRFFGTATASYGQIVRFENASAVAAAQNQIWTLSLFAKIAGGSATGISSFNTGFAELDSGGASVAASNATVVAPTSAPLGVQRVNRSRTLTAATAATLDAYYWFNITSGATIDITIRFGWPQLEQWSTSVNTVGGPSSPIRTAGAAAARAADSISFSLTPTLSAYTIAGVANPQSADTNAADQVVFAANDGTVSNELRVRRNAGVASSRYFISGTGVSGTPSPGAWTQNTRAAFAAAVGTNDQAVSFNGSGAAAASPTPSGVASVNNVRLGANGAGAAPLYGYVERFAVYPYRAANSNLQTFSTLTNWGG